VQSLQQLKPSNLPSDAGTTFKAFVLGAVGTIIGTIIAFACVGRWMGPDGWKIASCLCASYVGGSINYAATAQALGLASGGALAAGGYPSSGQGWVLRLGIWRRLLTERSTGQRDELSVWKGHAVHGVWPLVRTVCLSFKGPQTEDRQGSGNELMGEGN
jgi:hypothetical protein